MKSQLKNSCPIVGIDIAKAKFDVYLRLTDRSGRTGTFPNNEEGFAALVKWLQSQKLQDVVLAMEATGPYWMGLACYLHAHQFKVYVFNPAYVKAHAQSRGCRTKNDRVDARLIADYLATHECEAWEPLPAEREELRELMRLYADATALAVSASQRGEGLRTGPAQELQAQLAQLLEEFAQRVLERAGQHARQHPSLERPLQQLDSIPGIGEITALVLVAELPRGRSARSVAAWAGVTPRQCQSGTSVHRPPKMCKQGSDYVRHSLYWPAVTALRCCPAMRQLSQRLEGAGLNKMQIIGAAMHKLARWAAGVLNSDKMFDPSLHEPAQNQPQTA